MKDRLDQIFEFAREIDKEKKITRQNYLTDGSRQENDSEHAWHMAIMAMLMSEYSNEEIDLAKTMGMLLIHDLVEIDAGDTYAYDEKAKESQEERELAAADRIFHILPEDLAEKMYQYWREFEERTTPEAKFARMLDNVQPLMLNDASNGQAWRDHSVRLSQMIGRHKTSKDGSEVIWEYVKEEMIHKNVKKKNIIQDVDWDEMP